MLSTLRHLSRRVGLRFFASPTYPSVLFGKSDISRPPCTITRLQKKNGLYVDQTDYLVKLFTGTDFKVQAAVPKRFSKSTNLDLISDMCREDAREVFKDTHLGRSDFFNTEWKPPYPVMKFSFAELRGLEPAELKARLLAKVHQQFKMFGFSMSDNVPAGEKLAQLLDFIKAKGKDAVVLVDEYDVPVDKNNKLILNILHDFFSPLKRDAVLTKLVMLGTHKLLDYIGTSTNDTQDLMQKSPFYNMFGFTQEHVEEIFSERDPDFEKFTPLAFKSTVTLKENPELYKKQKLKWITEQLKLHYDGYCFSGRKDAVNLYNPYSVMRFRNQEGTVKAYTQIEYNEVEHMQPTLLKFPELLNSTVTCSRGSTFTVNAVAANSDHSENIKLLWGLGALTIKEEDAEKDLVTLRATNEEMETNYTQLILTNFVRTGPSRNSKRLQKGRIMHQ